MKVKIFNASIWAKDKPIDVRINDFIKDKKVISITHQADDTSTEIVVMYEEPNFLQQKTFDEFSEDDEVNEFLESHDVIQVDHLPDCYTVVTYRKSKNNED